MENLRYVECQNCGTIHYVVNAKEAKILEKSEVLFDEFSSRNLKYCSNCGLKSKFLEVSEDYMSNYSHDNKIPPILLEDEGNKTTTKGAKNLP